MINKKILKCITCIALTGFVALSSFWSPVPVLKADPSLDDLRAQLSDTQDALDELLGSQSELQGEKAAIDEEIREMDTNLIQLMTSIDLLEEEIAAKVVEVMRAEDALNDAKRREQEQYEAMKIRIRFMFEHGEYSYMQLLLETHSIADLMNKADYIERLYEYDRKLLLEYQEVVEEVKELKEKLEQEQAALEAEEFELEEEKESLEEALEEKKAEAEDYDAQISSIRSQASRYTALVRQQTSQIQQIEAQLEAQRKAALEAQKKAQEEALRKAKEEEERKKAASGEATSESTKESRSSSETSESSESTKTTKQSTSSSQAVSMISSASGSSRGKEIASFACKYIGNPYVPGGTSLTNGADCSGFTQTVFSNFGVSLPRNSASQRESGKSVSYSEAQPGDLICYPGHVAIYIGNGYIVHASTQKTGIKISPATYRDILAVRRVL